MIFIEQYQAVRKATEAICRPLQTEDYVVQPIGDVSPPKWHLGHTTWFWETFVLSKYKPGYLVFHPDYNFVFNSYYETIGARVIRTDRGNLSRPSVQDVYRYREYVDREMIELLSSGSDIGVSEEFRQTVLLGLNHEQQHQELLWTDIKYILGHNPLFPAWSDQEKSPDGAAGPAHPDDSAHPDGHTRPDSSAEIIDKFIRIPAGMVEIGFEGDGFCFDNEQARHKVYLNEFSIASSLVTNGEYLAFILAGGYSDFRFWHAEGWDWVKNNTISAPLYWHFIEGAWFNYTLRGLKPVVMNESLCHISYYEAAAYAAWVGMRLPTEWEWEAS
ncbi:ergothioneine biosynthesis protein EgtB, partial [Flavitalea flava]